MDQQTQYPESRMFRFDFGQGDTAATKHYYFPPSLLDLRVRTLSREHPNARITVYILGGAEPEQVVLLDPRAKEVLSCQRED